MVRFQKIPREFTEQSKVRMILMVSHRLLTFVVGVGLLTALYGSGWHLTLILSLAIPIHFIAACALHNIALLGHEGTHFTLAQDRMASARIGTFFSAMVPMHFNTGFCVSHAQHHWYTNSDKDPDLNIFLPQKSLLQRFLLARSRASRAYFKETVKLANGKLSYPNQVGIKDNELFSLAKFNLFWSFGFLCFYGYLIALAPTTFGPAFIVTFLLAVALSAIRPYLEHVNTDEGAFSRARTFSSPVLDYMFGTINYHQAHHMYPSVPGYNLPKLQVYLEKNKYIDASQARTESSFKDLYRALTKWNYGSTPLN